MSDVRITYVGGPTALIEIDPGVPHRSDVRPARQALLLRLGHGLAQAAGAGGPVRGPRADRRRAGQPRSSRRQPRSTPAARCCRAWARSSRRSPARSVWAGRARSAAVGDDDARGRGPPAARDHRDAVPPRPAGSHPIVGDVIGFALRWDGQEHGELWISGDTVLYDGVREVADAPRRRHRDRAPRRRAASRSPAHCATR